MQQKQEQSLACGNGQLSPNPGCRDQNHIMELYDLGPGAFTLGTALMKHALSELLQLPQAYKLHWIESAEITKACRDRQKAGPYHCEWHSYMQTWLIPATHIG